MLIGLSISKCVSDIFLEIVDINDVVVIVGRTDFNEKSMDDLIDGYRFVNGPWAEYEHSDMKLILEELWHRGKIHQPRHYGAHPRMVPYGKHWLRLAPEPMDLTPAAQKAYNHYLLISGLSQKKETEY